MHGLGNDFVIVNKRDLPKNCDLSKLSLNIANRRIGVGCDQFIIYNQEGYTLNGFQGADSILMGEHARSSTYEYARACEPGKINTQLLKAEECASDSLNEKIKYSYEMWVYNQDGSSAKLCGNASRCLAKLIYINTGIAEITLKIEGKELVCRVLSENEISVDVGIVSFNENWMPRLDKIWELAERYMIDLKEVICADIGNPHFIIFSELNDQDKMVLGEKFQEKELFADGVNVNFASIKDNKIYLSVWERGVGLTLACGSGACASFAAAVKLGFVCSPCEVVFPIGSLKMLKQEENPSENFFMTKSQQVNQQVVTFGCRLNIYESEIIKNNLILSDLDNVMVFNTCAVTKEAEKQSRQAIRKAKTDNPNVQIIVTGCAAQNNPTSFKDMAEVDKVIGNTEKLLPTHYHFNGENVVVNDIMSVTETANHLISHFEGKSRAFMQVQNGCNHRCTFCIIPYGRGNSRSVPIGVIVEQLRKLIQNGYNEVVFTGVDITAYGPDLPGSPTFAQMLKRVIKIVPELKRLRLSSIDVAEIDDELFNLMAYTPQIMPHFHISLQAGDDMILKRMKRRHNRQTVIDFCHKLRSIRPGVSFGADIIAGFPTETDAMFENTRRLIAEADLQYLHVFPYSERDETPAARMPQVAKVIRKARAKILRVEGQKQLQKFYQRNIGNNVELLIENNRIAHTENFIPVKLGSDFEDFKAGQLIEAQLVGIEGDYMLAKILVYGGGSWGSALACQVARCYNSVNILLRDNNILQEMETSRTNKKYLGENVRLPSNIFPSSQISAILEKEVIILALPSYAFTSSLNVLKEAGISPNVVLLVATKGFGKNPTELLSDKVKSILPLNPLAFISGPNLAVEVAKNLPTSVTIASPDIGVAKRLALSLRSEQFKVSITDYFVPIQVAGAVKNIIAIKSGLYDARNYGQNSKATLITDALQEIKILSEAIDGELGDNSILCAPGILGDLILTCYSKESRNTRFGYELGSQKDPDKFLKENSYLVEGREAAKLVFKNLPQAFYKLILLEFCLLLLIFPLENFRISLESVIFPSFEINILYYFSTIYHVNVGIIFLIGIIFDQLYSMSIGTNSLILLSAHIILQSLGKYFKLKSYFTNFIIFCLYYFFVLHARYLLIFIKGFTTPEYIIIIMQYLTTIFSYNLIRIPFDKILE
ncbi:Threonylcarbamoyladenosine tRNA methylthiotransferase MtaB, partial [Pseudolycoriella hygida]